MPASLAHLFTIITSTPRTAEIPNAEPPHASNRYASDRVSHVIFLATTTPLNSQVLQ
jgi:hypothetical protein